MTSRRLRVLVAPWLDANPYQRLLHEALAARGVRVLSLKRLSLRGAMSMLLSTDVVHLHWLEYLTFTHRVTGLKSRLGAIARALALMTLLVIVRQSQVRLVWTVHNESPHDPRMPRLDRALARGAIWAADNIVVHSAYAANRVASAFGEPRAITVAYHGNYLGAYPAPSAASADLRAARNIPREAFVYLVFGHVRRYKRIHDVLAAFRGVDDPAARLIVAGAVDDESLRTEIEHAAARDARVQLEFGFLTESQVSDLHALSNAAIFNYAEVFSSGALLLALSQGVPVVTPVRGSSSEVASPPALVSFAPGRLRDALLEIRTGNHEERRASALQAARANSWELAADRVLAAYCPATSGIAS